MQKKTLTEIDACYPVTFVHNVDLPQFVYYISVTTSTSKTPRESKTIHNIIHKKQVRTLKTIKTLKCIVS